ncbi:hypothetical protein SE17_33740 [Kouleothrix aurantiaca]|uniref:Uncharacterized protein n=1 Tax=Kouleothrix aurantiaca TaxID=186479 RepID=A0A0P9F9T9_9CHLR|nr:hypothetical protein SE17_33740 [Kouleothrix aurantiaca]
MPTDDAALVASWRPAFEALYARDAQNARRQPFEEYWRWVQTYLLEGGAGNPGWLAQRTTLLARVRDAEARARLAPQLEVLGRAIAGEWAKDSATRRIHSTFLQGRPNLMSWGRALETAARRDTGDGQAIEAAVRAIQAELDALRVPGAVL